MNNSIGILSLQKRKTLRPISNSVDGNWGIILFKMHQSALAIVITNRPNSLCCPEFHQLDELTSLAGARGYP